jgi:ATP-dependent DNA helicase RecQ
MLDKAKDVLKAVWGYDSFRNPQDLIIQAVLDGKDTLALMPTGGGKSLCYQVPALVQENMTIVISPLIALMKDQVYHLKERNVLADAIYSGMNFKEIERIFNNSIFGNTKLLYMSPERLFTPYAIEKISQMKVDLLAIDEAHCISQWGYDFRPAYLEIAKFRELHPDTPMLALTATATKRVVEDIQDKLKFIGRHVIKSSFYRGNLAYVTIEESNKRRRLLSVLKNVKGSAVVYANTRRQCKELASFIHHNGISVDFYHAGLEKTERNTRQEDWLQGKTRVIVATNAFGMGIDHPHVRSVIHMSPPASLEAYFQEAGRAGRDGEKAYAVLMFDGKDLVQLKEYFNQSFPDISEIKSIYHALGSYLKVAIGAHPEESFDFEIHSFIQNYGFPVQKVLQTLRILSEHGYLYITEAVFIPSRLIFNVSQEELYDFILRKPKDGEILKTLLRIFQGVFEHNVSIDEYKVAQFLKIRKQDLILKLKQLHMQGLILYTPTKDFPQLIYLCPREDIKNLAIDVQKINLLKKWKEEMLESVIKYTTTFICRSMQLLDYFDEVKEEPCGICDVCLELAKSKKYRMRFDEIKSEILEKGIVNTGITAEELNRIYKGNDRSILKDVLQFLSDEQFIYQEGNLFFTIKKK